MYEDDPRPVQSIAEVIRDAMETGDFIRVEGFLTGLLGSAMRDVTVNVGTVTKLFLANVGHRMMSDRQYEEGKKLEDQIERLEEERKDRKKLEKRHARRPYTKKQLCKIVHHIAEKMEKEYADRCGDNEDALAIGEQERAVMLEAAEEILNLKGIKV